MYEKLYGRSLYSSYQESRLKQRQLKRNVCISIASLIIFTILLYFFGK